MMKKQTSPRFNPNTRLDGTETLMEVVQKMSSGNLGAFNFLIQLISTDRFIDILTLDQIGVYDENIYYLWKDCCKHNMYTFDLIICNCNYGEISPTEVLSKIKSCSEFTNLKSPNELREE